METLISHISRLYGGFTTKILARWQKHSPRALAATSFLCVTIQLHLRYWEESGSGNLHVTVEMNPLSCVPSSSTSSTNSQRHIFLSRLSKDSSRRLRYFRQLTTNWNLTSFRPNNIRTFNCIREARRCGQLKSWLHHNTLNCSGSD